jgi:hypothetical protein
MLDERLFGARQLVFCVFVLVVGIGHGEGKRAGESVGFGRRAAHEERGE